MTPTQIYFAAAAMLLTLAAPLNANAHLMVEQRGTINIVDDGAFIVVSVPVAAFVGIDDDGEGDPADGTRTPTCVADGSTSESSAACALASRSARSSRPTSCGIETLGQAARRV